MAKNAFFGDNPKRVGKAERIWAPIKLKLTEDYDYVSRNVFIRFFYYIFIWLGMPFVYLYQRIKYDFEIIGKENADSIKNISAVTVSNHVHNVDSVLLTRAFYPNTPYIIALKHNIEMFVVGGMVRVLRAVPVPDSQDRGSFEKFQQDINRVLKTTDRKVHIFPEGSIEQESRTLRKFKKGAFYFAVRNDVPVLPMVFVFPRPNKPKLIIGKPIFKKDIEGIENLSEPKQVVKIATMTINSMQSMLDEFYGKEAD